MSAAVFEASIKVLLVVVIIGWLLWRLVQIAREPRPKNHRDKMTSKGGWKGGKR